ncbi:response regulator [Natronorubrum sp. FCH18a]|uniref:response regulator n=1 Tax=Natronorubrum sp. FCH18a TaxID=3447018 RepID=UPI003F515513
MFTSPTRPCPAEPIDILLVEDSPHDVRLIREAFELPERDSGTRLHTVTRGTDVVPFLRREGEYESVPPTNLVLLDLQVPSRDGCEILAAIDDDPQLRQLPVIVLTNSEATAGIVRSYEAHVNACLTKPTEWDDVVSLVESIERFWLTQAQLPSVSV